MDLKMISILVDRDDWAELKKVAEQQTVSRSEIVRTTVHDLVLRFRKQAGAPAPKGGRQ
jgi:metal-responsive CopG/Arc/MetJ family transcriptional regulator